MIKQHNIYCYILLTCVLLLSQVAQAQVDTTYIGEYEKTTAISTNLTKDFLGIRREFGKNDRRNYLPNNPLSIGLGLSMYNTVLSFGFGQSFDFMRDRKKGKTKAFDFQMHNYGRKVVFDISIQNYKGFYISNRRNKFEKTVPDLHVRQYSGNAMYVFNNKKFSYKAAFNQNERQLKSAGSFLLGISGYYTSMKSDSTYFDETNMDRFKNYQFGILGGYAHSWVVDRRWSFTASGTFGLNLGASKLKDHGSTKMEVYPCFYPRLAIGYNRTNWSLGLYYINNISFLSFRRNANTTMLSGKVQLTYILRINDIPFLSKLFRRL